MGGAGARGGGNFDSDDGVMHAVDECMNHQEERLIKGIIKLEYCWEKNALNSMVIILKNKAQISLPVLFIMLARSCLICPRMRLLKILHFRNPVPMVLLFAGPTKFFFYKFHVSGNVC